MRWQSFVLVLASILVCVGVCGAVMAKVPSMGDLDQIAYDYGQSRGYVDDKRLDFLANIAGTNYTVLEVNDPSANVSVSPSYIFVTSGLMRSSKDGEIVGGILYAATLINSGAIQKACNQMASLDSAIGNSKMSADNKALAGKIAIDIVAAFSREDKMNADKSAFEQLPTCGYPSSCYIDLLSRANGDLFSGNLPARIAALKKLPPVEPTTPAPTYMPPKESVPVVKSLRETGRIKEIDPTSFLPAVSGDSIPGYLCVKEKADVMPLRGKRERLDIFLFFNRTGKITTYGPKTLSEAFRQGYGRMATKSFCLDDDTNKTTQIVILCHNLSQSKTPFLLRVNVNDETGVVDREIKEPAEWHAVSVNVNDLKGENSLYVAALSIANGIKACRIVFALLR